MDLILFIVCVYAQRSLSNNRYFRPPYRPVDGRFPSVVETPFVRSQNFIGSEGDSKQENFPHKFTEKDLLNQFSIYGVVLSVNIIKNAFNKPLNFAFIEFESKSSLEQAVQKKILNIKVITKKRYLELKEEYLEDQSASYKNTIVMELGICIASNVDLNLDYQELLRLFKVKKSKPKFIRQKVGKTTILVEYSSVEEAKRAIDHFKNNQHSIEISLMSDLDDLDAYYKEFYPYNKYCTHRTEMYISSRVKRENKCDHSLSFKNKHVKFDDGE